MGTSPPSLPPFSRITPLYSTHHMERIWRRWGGWLLRLHLIDASLAAQLRRHPRWRPGIQLGPKHSGGCTNSNHSSNVMGSEISCQSPPKSEMLLERRCVQNSKAKTKVRSDHHKELCVSKWKPNNVQRSPWWRRIKHFTLFICSFTDSPWCLTSKQVAP